MKSIEIKNIKVTAKLWKSIGECLKDCIELAAKEWQNVELFHCDKTYKINVNDLVASVNDVKNEEESN